MIENSLNETDVLLHQLFDRAARLRSEAIALVYQDRRISFFELQLYVEWMSGYFQTINLQTGQRVALLMENSPKLVISLFGLWRAGVLPFHWKSQVTMRICVRSLRWPKSASS